MRRFHKNLIRTLLLLLVLSAVFPFVFPWKDGKPLLSWKQLKLPALPDISLPDIPLPVRESNTTKQKISVYKWRDEQGSWQFGNEPPQGVAYELLELDPDTNVLPAIKAEPPAVPTADIKTKNSAQPDDDKEVFGYTPEKIEAMMEKTRQVRDSLDAHHRALEGLDQ